MTRPLTTQHPLPPSTTPTLISSEPPGAIHDATSCDSSVLEEKKDLFLDDPYPRVPTLVHGSAELSELSLPGPARVVSLNSRDSAALFHGWRRFAFLLSPIAFIVVQASAIIYIILRYSYIRSAMHNTGTNYTAAWLFLVVECCFLFGNLLQAIWNLVLWKPRGRPQLRLVGTEGLPTADVLICCCGEDVDIILDTLRGACAMSYPVDRFRVFISNLSKRKYLVMLLM